jgi:hypothetical protein
MLIAGAALIAGPVALSGSPVAAGLTNCSVTLSNNNDWSICYTPNAGNPYPDNQQRAKANCNGSTYYGVWVGHSTWSEAPSSFSCSVQTTSNTYQRR